MSAGSPRGQSTGASLSDPTPSYLSRNCKWELLWLNFPCSQPWCVLPAWVSSAAKPGMLTPTAHQVMDEQGLCSSPGAVRVLAPRGRCWARCCTEGLWRVPQVGMQQGAFSGMAKDFG